MNTMRVDAHGHLYECFSVAEWSKALFATLGDGGCVIVVDRQGQDTLSRLRTEVPSCAEWEDFPETRAGVLKSFDGSKRVLVLQGVQYAAKERIEVLGLGVGRLADDGLSAEQYLGVICQAGGKACLPWSPGKWLGTRGKVVRKLLDSHTPQDFVVGDIAIRSSVGPYSPLLRYARKRGYHVVRGTDPLPRVADQKLVGSFYTRIEGAAPGPVPERVAWILDRLGSGDGCLSGGRRNGPVRAAVRFVAAFSSPYR